jgi:pilus assembly protein CpaB
MATRFGATPAHTYATKVKWLVGCLVSLIALLIVAFVIVAQSGQAVGTAMQAQPAAEPAPPPVSPGVEVVVAKNRIEEGARLDHYMFDSVQMEESRVPMGVIRKQDLEKVAGKYAAKLIAPNVPLVLEDVSENRPINLLNIPPGYRAVTITVDARSGVEGFAKPNSRVDVLWTFTQEGKQKVATIVRFTKVLSVGGVTAAEQNKAQVGGDRATTVTLLVSEKDAKKIELARTLGSLSLSLVGDQEEGSKDSDPDAITISDLTNSGLETPNQPQEVSSDGVMYTTDPKTGRQIRYILNKSSRKWMIDRTFGGEG